MKRLLLFCIVCASSAPAAPVDWAKQVAPILKSQCNGCHGVSQALGGVRVDSRAALNSWIVVGKPEQSRFYQVLELTSGSPKAMPPGQQLAKGDREVLRQWIAEGAVWPEGASLVAAVAPAKTNERANVMLLYARIIAKRTQESGAPKPYKASIPNTEVSFEMIPIQAGSFTMGTPESENGRRKDEGNPRTVKVDGFWMGKTEVTWDEYRLFMFAQQARETAGQDPEVDAISRPTRPYVEMSFGMGINGFPAISMTQHAANKYAEWLSAKTGQFYRLPTEAEWEYACRAGTTTAYSFGADAPQLGDYGWFADNSDGKYQKVGTKKPNAWGLHDMHGNVMEWTLDQYDASGYRGLPDENPWRVSTQPYPQSVRGGSWMDDAGSARCGARIGSDPSWKQQDPQLPKSIWYHTDAQGLGFRLVRPWRVPSAEEMYKYWNNGVENEP